VAKEGIITELRARALLDFPFDADLVLHECGGLRWFSTPGADALRVECRRTADPHAA
jgi:hypothetical protein